MADAMLIDLKRIQKALCHFGDFDGGAIVVSCDSGILY